MKPSRLLPRLLFWLGLPLLFLWMTWPLGRFLTTGIPYTPDALPGGPLDMFAGDQLQLLYYFDLVKGFVSGATPWFHNLYEFNLGDDAATFQMDAYYMPFTLVHAAGALLLGSAFGWNLASLFSVMLGAAGTWKLVRRFEAPTAVAIGATALGILLPYRWITLLHGSPTGFAMAYVPWILLGLDLCIREHRMRWGTLAGFVWLLASWGDLHTFFFSALLIPFWCIFSLVLSGQDPCKRDVFLRLLRSLSGFIVFGVIVVLKTLWVQSKLKAGTMSGGRSLLEIGMFSPMPNGFFGLDPNGRSHMIYLTFLGVIMLLVSLIYALRAQHDRRRTLLLLHAGLLAGICGVLLLSLGPNLPGNGVLWWQRLIRVFPPYGMIRQPPKIFSILPALLAVAVVFPFIGRPVKQARPWTLLFTALTLGLLVEARGRMHTGVCVIDTGNEAYAAVRAAADARNENPHALIVVLWPGNSHWASLYQHYSIRHGIRMVNGYLPNVPQEYVDTVFYRYRPLNQGFADDDMLDSLLSRGIRYVLLHEDAFPEKVSPFAVAQTLGRLLRHPRLRFLKQDRAVWAFEITETAREEHIHPFPDLPVSAAYLWHFPNLVPKEQPRIAAADAFRQAAARVSSGDPAIELSAYPTFYRPGLRTALRVRGEGRLQVQVTVDAEAFAPISLEIDSSDWEWHEIPFSEFPGFAEEIYLKMEVLAGSLDLDIAMMLEGPTPGALAVGESFHLPAPAFFHAGYTDAERGVVIQERNRVQLGEAFYGPLLFFPPGDYEVTFDYQVTNGPETPTRVGAIRIREPHPQLMPEPVPVLSGETQTRFEFTLLHSLPVSFAFRHERVADVEIQGVTFTRLR